MKHCIRIDHIWLYVTQSIASIRDIILNTPNKATARTSSKISYCQVTNTYQQYGDIFNYVNNNNNIPGYFHDIIVEYREYTMS